MTIPEILKELQPYTGRFPKKAMEAAIEQREAITPELLRVVEQVAENPVKFAKQQDYMLHVFALYLLAQFREKRAYPLIVKMFSAPGETPFDLAGDTVTEGLKRILGSVYDGNPALLQALIEDDNVNEYVRGAAVEAFVVLEESGQVSREDVMAYFQSLFRGKLPRTHSHAWDDLVCCVADLPAPELLEDVRQAYADGIIDSGFADLEGIERDLLGQVRPFQEQYRIITDAIAEMEGWACFHPEPTAWSRKQRPEASTSHSNPPSPPPVQRAKVGRNAPCPCGSGKKYKKCCGQS